MRHALLRYLMNRISTSLWLLPLICVIAACFSAWVFYHIDNSQVGLKLSYWLGIHSLDASSAKLILSTIAGSMMTIASLVFSITLMTLTLASQQLGSRLIEWFMNNRLTQLVLGSYIALFVYTLLSIGSVSDNDTGFNSHITVVAAICATVANLILLVIYIHRAALHIQTDTVISASGNQLNESIESRFKTIGQHAQVEVKPYLEGEPVTICATDAGYVQTIDIGALLDLATKHEGFIKVERQAGDFVVEGVPLARIWGCGDEALEKIEDNVRGNFVFGPKRTAAQDIQFALRGLVEIALRALSPGINDPHTALACIDYIGSALVKLMTGPVDPKMLPDDKGIARLALSGPSLDDYADTGFNPIRHAGADNPLVLGRLADVQLMLLSLSDDEEECMLWKRHLRRTLETAERCIAEPAERVDLQQRIGTAIGAR
ncbi:MAG: DUF2254 domain-containing protein [Geminicoccaceae bacterium]|nr:DUF2254 domain-containing protein [Geminicoccaceae bacterium]